MGWAARARQGKPNPTTELPPPVYLVEAGKVTPEGEKRYVLDDGGRLVKGVATYYRKIRRKLAPKVK